MFMEREGSFGAEGFVLSQVLKGIQRTGTVRPEELYVVTYDQVMKIFKLLPLVTKTKFDSQLLSAAVFMLYFTLCRVGEVVGSDHALTRSSVEFAGGNLFLTFRTHKTLKPTSRPQLVRVPPSGQELDLGVLTEYDRVRPVTSPQAQYLVWEDSTPLGASHIRSVISRIKAVVFGLGNPTLHAFRRGGAVHWYKMGAPERDIQTIGRWSGESHLVYLSKNK